MSEFVAPTPDVDQTAARLTRPPRRRTLFAAVAAHDRDLEPQPFGAEAGRSPAGTDETSHRDRFARDLPDAHLTSADFSPDAIAAALYAASEAMGPAGPEVGAVPAPLPRLSRREPTAPKPTIASPWSTGGLEPEALDFAIIDQAGVDPWSLGRPEDDLAVEAVADVAFTEAVPDPSDALDDQADHVSRNRIYGGDVEPIDAPTEYAEFRVAPAAVLNVRDQPRQSTLPTFAPNHATIEDLYQSAGSSGFQRLRSKAALGAVAAVVLLATAGAYALSGSDDKGATIAASRVERTSSTVTTGGSDPASVLTATTTIAAGATTASTLTATTTPTTVASVTTTTGSSTTLAPTQPTTTAAPAEVPTTTVAPTTTLAPVSTVSAAAGKITVSPGSLTFSPGVTQLALTLSNVGGRDAAYQVSTEPTAGLSVSSGGGTLASGTSTIVLVNLNRDAGPPVADWTSTVTVFGSGGTGTIKIAVRIYR